MNTETEFGYVRKNLHRLTQLSSQFSPKIRICFRCNMKYSEECFITYPNTSKCVKKTRLRLDFSTHFSVFRYVMKHSSSCFIYYFKKHFHVTEVTHTEVQWNTVQLLNCAIQRAYTPRNSYTIFSRLVKQPSLSKRKFSVPSLWYR